MQVLNAARSGKTILIVEDNELSMKLFVDVLEVHGHTVIPTKLGLDGLRLAKLHRPDLILMDIQLPNGVSGIDAAQMIRTDDELKAIPIVAVTVSAMKGDEERIRDTGWFDGYMAKPIMLEPFLEMVARFIYQKP